MRKRLNQVLFLLLVIAVCSVPVVSVQAKYYSTSGAGLSTNWYKKQCRIVSIKGNTLRYRSVKIVPNAIDFDLKFGKIKKAKLTSKTKYYVGSIKRYNAGKKWIKKVSKKTFKKKLTGKEWWDVVKIKKGKVTRVYTKMQIAS